MGGYITFRSFRVRCTGVQMGRKKNKKKIKGFPGNDLYITIGIVVVVGVAMIIKACNG